MEIIRGITKPKGLRIVVYGCHGIGKTTLASKLPDALFLDYESGTHGMDVAKVGKLPCSYAAVKGLFDELKRDHNGFRNLVIDSVDKLEEVLDKTYCEETKKGVDSLFSLNDYGRTIAAHKSQMGQILDKATELANSGMNVIWIAHEQSRKCEPLEGSGAYDHHEMKLSKTVTPLFMEAADVVIFCAYKTFVVAADKQKGETKGHVEGGKRWCYTAHSNDWDAKHRVCIDLPDDCSLDKMVTLLPKAIEEAVCAVSEQPKTESVAPAPKPTEAVSAPVEKKEEKEESAILQEFRQLLGNYSISEDEIRAYASESKKLKERYGSTFDFKTAPLCTWPEYALSWMCKGMDKIAAKIK